MAKSTSSSNQSARERRTSRKDGAPVVAAPNAAPAAATAVASAAVSAYGNVASAVIAVKLTSDGRIQVVAGDCPLSNVAVGGNPPTQRYATTDHALQGAADVRFWLRLAKVNSKYDPSNPATLRKVGNLTIEAVDWVRAYDIQRVHLLGYVNPFGTDIDHRNYGGVNRDANIPANREFEGVFHYVPAAGANPAVATLTLTDVESKGTSSETIDIAKLADDGAGTPGAIFVAIKVSGINYEDDCATIEFDARNVDGGNPLAFDGRTRSGAQFRQFLRFNLRESTDQP